ncbi:MAG: single-stranded-DNA-specific exonuclease RecJ [Chloroflexi bacterium]|nr:single-stranded-DNA-specific exonuclease RecJ [Chloroflexota bacterium]
MGLGHSRWNLLPSIPDDQAIKTAGFSRLIAQLLYNRGLTDPAQLEIFIAADQRLSGDPALLPDMHRAVSRIYRALLSGENIAIYGDFDTDGVTSTALLVQGLAALNCRAVPYIPHRLTEGYGIRTAALENLRRQGVSLVITVDCGITAVAELKRARKLGLDVIITDHHTPLAEIPPALAVVDPKLSGSNYPFGELAGVGVAFKLLQALFQGIGKEKQLENLLDLVALGTVADMMPMLGENRYLVSQGLKVLNSSLRLGLREIMSQVRLDTRALDAESISWIIAPRLNAAGRLEHAMGSYRLLVTDVAEEAHELATWLEQKNTERQNLTAKALTRARELVLSQGLTPLLFVADPDFATGVCGLVASRLSDEFYRPAVVVRTGERFSGGSCRSIPEFNIIFALNQCSSLFSHFGGHSQAAGFGMPTRNLPRLQEALIGIASRELKGVDLRPRIDIEVEAKLSELGGNTFQMIQSLAPFGKGNPAPTFLSRQVEVVDSRVMGGNSEHLRLRLKHGGVVWDAVAFDFGDYRTELSANIDIVYNMEIDRWNGAERLRLNILDFVPSVQAAKV